jgi:prolyl-tRNA editing enzyme YbaK/EbsC (Cys-tRNA(Pro) deacylase)
MKIMQKSAQSVQDRLTESGLDFQVLELADSTRTANDAAVAIGCTVAQIVKSLIFKTTETGKPVLVLASGPNRVNEKTIERHMGEKIEKADADFARSITGFAIGGIPPIGHQTPIEHIFIDEDLLPLGDLWAAAGTPHAVFNLKAEHLQNLTKGKVISVK